MWTNIAKHGFNSQYLRKIFNLFGDYSYTFAVDFISYEVEVIQPSQMH